MVTVRIKPLSAAIANRSLTVSSSITHPPLPVRGFRAHHENALMVTETRNNDAPATHILASGALGCGGKYYAGLGRNRNATARCSAGAMPLGGVSLGLR